MQLPYLIRVSDYRKGSIRRKCINFQEGVDCSQVKNWQGWKGYSISETGSSRFRFSTYG